MTNRNVYISSCCEKGGIYQYNLCNGVLEKEHIIKLDRPMYSIINDGKLYVILRAPYHSCSESGMVAFNISPKGVLTKRSDILSTKGEVACHLCQYKGSIYAVNYISGSVIKMPDKVITHTGNSINPKRQESAHTHFVSPTPDDKYLCVTDLGMDKIFIYDKELNEVSAVDARKGAGPRHLAFSDDGCLCFCVNELDSSVSVYEYNDGKLKLVNTYSTLPEGYIGENTAAAIRCRGEYVYVSNRGHNSIACYKIIDNSLKIQSITDCGGESPRDFDISDDVLICTNENDGSVVVFDVIENTTLKQKQKINVPNALCVTIY